jgi:hypothetical protein
MFQVRTERNLCATGSQKIEVNRYVQVLVLQTAAYEIRSCFVRASTCNLHRGYMQPGTRATCNLAQSLHPTDTPTINLLTSY